MQTLGMMRFDMLVDATKVQSGDCMVDPTTSSCELKWWAKWWRGDLFFLTILHDAALSFHPYRRMALFERDLWKR